MEKILRTRDDVEGHLLLLEDGQYVALYQDLVLKSAFQPIVRADGCVFAYEALMRVFNSDGVLLNNGDLINYYQGLPVHLINIDRLARVVHLRNFSRIQTSAKLFINMMPATILFCESEGLVDSILLPRIYELGLKPAQIYVEILEHHTDDDEALTRAIRHLKQAGLNIVIDDFGIEASSEQRARAVTPDIIKADASLLTDYMQGNTQPLLNVWMLCRELKSKFIIEGVEDMKGYDTALSLGADFLQGFYVGFPQLNNGEKHIVSRNNRSPQKGNADQPN